MTFEKRMKEIQMSTELQAFGDRPARVVELVNQAIAVMDESPEDFEIPGLGVVWWTYIRSKLERAGQNIEHVIERAAKAERGST